MSFSHEDERTETFGPVWSVWRQDENGNIFLVRDGLMKTDAYRLVRELEEEGHKQTYWAKENDREV